MRAFSKISAFIRSIQIHPACKPFEMKVRIVGHGYRVGYNISANEQYVTTVMPVEVEFMKKYGNSIDIYSKGVFDSTIHQHEAVLQFVDNPNYDPALYESQPVLIYEPKIT